MEHDAFQFAESLRGFAAELAIPIPDSAIHLFAIYFNELKKWNKTINLTAIDDDREILVKHFIDSIVGTKVIDDKSENDLLDIGSGAGFPALPLKFIRPELSVELLEPSEKKGSFLRYMIGSLGLRQVTVATAKLEHYVERRTDRRTFDYIIVRAFRVDGLGRLLVELLKPGGKVILYRAERVRRGFDLAGLALVEELEYELPAGYGHRVLSVFSK